MVKFISLNEDCLNEIFKWLSLDDLCRLSKTCTHLQQVTGNYFAQRKYSSKWLCVTNATTEGIVLSPNKDYVKCFSKNIQNVSIDYLRKNHDVLAEFLQSNCNGRLKKLQFKCSYLPKTFGDHIRTVLENAETLVFRNCLLDGGNIISDCGEMKNLFIIENLLNDQYEHVEELLVGQYPTLQHFHCRYAGFVDMNKLKSFLEHNKVKSLTWYFFRRHWTVIQECINTIVNYATNLEEFFLSIEGEDYNLTEISQKLKCLCDRNSFKRLEFQFIGEEAERKMFNQCDALISLKSLVGLHLCAFRNFQNVVPIISKLPHLKILQLKKDSEVDHVVFPLPNQSLYALPNLEQLHLIGLQKNFNYIHAFILNATKLKKVIVKDCAFTEFHISKLNASRQKQPFACETTIYTEQYNICTDLSHNLIKMKRMDFEIDEFNLNDPFICHSMRTVGECN